MRSSPSSGGLVICAAAGSFLVFSHARADLAQTTLLGTASNASSVSARLTLSWDDAADELVVQLQNTSDTFGVNSTITGFALMGGSPSASTGDFRASGTADDSEWKAKNSLAANPNGSFDFGGISGANFNGGDPQAGIIQGAMGTFVFSNFSSSHTSALDFLADLNGAGYAFAIRFQSVSDPQGQGDGGGAKLAGYGGTLVTVHAPVPSAALLGALGLIMIGGRRKSSAN